ncbi:MAG: hypothetical protein ABL308_05585 [Oceanicaulis sp.]
MWFNFTLIESTLLVIAGVAVNHLLVAQVQGQRERFHWFDAALKLGMFGFALAMQIAGAGGLLRLFVSWSAGLAQAPI